MMQFDFAPRRVSFALLLLAPLMLMGCNTNSGGESANYSVNVTLSQATPNSGKGSFYAEKYKVEEFTQSNAKLTKVNIIGSVQWVVGELEIIFDSSSGSVKSVSMHWDQFGVLYKETPGCSNLCSGITVDTATQTIKFTNVALTGSSASNPAAPATATLNGEIIYTKPETNSNVKTLTTDQGLDEAGSTFSHNFPGNPDPYVIQLNDLTTVTWTEYDDNMFVNNSKIRVTERLSVTFDSAGIFKSVGYKVTVTPDFMITDATLPKYITQIDCDPTLCGNIKANIGARSVSFDHQKINISTKTMDITGSLTY